MNDVVVALIAAASVASLFVTMYVWQGRQFRGKHSFYDRELSAGALIRMAEPSIELDRAAHRELQARLRAHQERRERRLMPPCPADKPGRHRLREAHSGSPTTLLSGESRLFCGAYGGPSVMPPPSTGPTGVSVAGSDSLPSSRR